MVKQGLEAVQRNWRSAGIYIGLATAVHGAIIGVELLVMEGLGEDQRQFFLFFRDIVLAAVYALGQTLAFGRMGKEIDRPYWKIGGDVDALRRFFVLWFILNLASMASLNLIFRTGNGGDPGGLIALLIIYILISGLLVPFGAAVMFHGRARRQEIGEALHVLVAQVPRLLPVLLLVYVTALFLYSVLLSGGFPMWASPLLTFIATYVDCAVFAATWHICMIHRDEESDDDFDF